MTTTLAGYTFEKDPVLEGLSNRQDVFATRYIAIDGTEVVAERTRACGYKLDLVMNERTGRLKKDTADDIKATNTPGAVVTLVYRGTSYTVRFRNEESGGAFDLRPLVREQDPQEDECWLIGTIRLMTVG